MLTSPRLLRFDVAMSLWPLLIENLSTAGASDVRVHLPQHGDGVQRKRDSRAALIRAGDPSLRVPLPTL